MEQKKTRAGVAGLLENEDIRRVNTDGTWRYSAVDLIAVLAETDHPTELWSDLKRRDPALGRLVEYREFQQPDGTVELLEVLSADGVFRAAQSVDSPRAERVRLWLAESGRQRLEEAENPELAMLRARREYEGKGYDRRWVDKRLRAMAARHELTSEWARRGATDSDQYRELTNQLMESAFGMTVADYRHHKGLTRPGQNLRDHMSDLELVLTMLGETAATALHRQHASQGFDQLLEDVKQAGEVTLATRRALADARTPRRRRERSDGHPGHRSEPTATPTDAAASPDSTPSPSSRHHAA